MSIFSNTSNTSPALAFQDDPPAVYNPFGMTAFDGADAALVAAGGVSLMPWVKPKTNNAAPRLAPFPASAKSAPIGVRSSPPVPKQMARKTVARPKAEAPVESSDAKRPAGSFSSSGDRKRILAGVGATQVSGLLHAQRAWKTAECAVCHTPKAASVVPCGLYCGCESLSICSRCFVKMRYGRGIVCNQCDKPLSDPMLLADQRVIKQALKIISSAQVAADYDVMLALSDWTLFGFQSNFDGFSMHVSSTPDQMFAFFNKPDKAPLTAWAVDGTTGHWVKLQGDVPLLLQGCSPRTNVKFSRAFQ